jgi:uncharacterized membrane protein
VNETATPAAAVPSETQASGARARYRLARLWRPDLVFAVLALGFGLVFVVLTPPFQVADEEAHFRRAFEISYGHFVAQKRGETTGDELPPGIDGLYDQFKSLKGHLEEKTSARDIRNSAEIGWNSGDRSFLVFSNSAVHSPLIYLPQALAIALARCVSPSVLACLYAGRVANLLATVALILLAIRVTPVGKWTFALLALAPMSLSLAASLSSDALTNAFSFLLLAQVFACSFGKEYRLRRFDVAAMVLLGAAIGLTKQMYFLLPLSYLLIPARKAGSVRQYLVGLVTVMASTMLAVAAWGLVVRRIWSPADPAMGMDPGEQLRGMLAHPFEFVRVLLTTSYYAGDRVEEYIGLLGWTDVRLPTGVYIGEIALLCLVCIREFGPNAGASTRQVLVAGGVALLVVLTVAVVIHLTWDKVGAAAISWHGRYFISIGPLVGLVVGQIGYLVPTRLRLAALPVPAVASLAVPVLLVASLLRVRDRYYVDTPHDAAERHSIRGRNLVGQGGGDLEQARHEFEEALRIDPSHTVSHDALALMFKDSDPEKAIKHFRAALTSSPEDSVALFELANILASRADFREAISLYREALRITGGNSNVSAALQRATQARDVTRRDLERVTGEFQHLVRTGMLDERRRPDGSVQLKHSRGPVSAVTPSGLISGLAFYWRIPPPSGREIRPGGDDVAGRSRLAFFACSTKLVFSKRVFVFPPPGQADLLADEAVSWYFQMRLTDLTPDESERERAFRAERGLRFPLSSLPD